MTLFQISVVLNDIYGIDKRFMEGYDRKEMERKKKQVCLILMIIIFLIILILLNEVTSINSYTFQNCSKLTSVTIPEGITSIGSRAFENCTSLNSITYKGVEYTSKSALESAL